jgi:hypothetical protein
MTTDVGKFIANRPDLEPTLAPVQRINRWCFVVPFYSSAELLKHAAKKTRELRAEALPYADPDIVVHVEALVGFRSELTAYAASARKVLHFEPAIVSDEDIKQFNTAQTGFIANLNRKLKAQPNKPSTDKLVTQATALMRIFIEFESIKGVLHKDNPRAYAEIMRCGQNLKRRLEVFNGSNSGDVDILERHFKALVEDIEHAVESLSRANVELISQGYLAQYLMDCTMEIA